MDHHTNKTIGDIRSEILRIREKSDICSGKVNVEGGRISVLSVSVDIISSLIVGAILGHGLDKLLNTKVVFTVICMCFALAAAMCLLYRRLKSDYKQVCDDHDA